MKTGDIAAGRDARQASVQDGGADKLAGLRPKRLVLDPAGPVGEALKAARQSLGLAEDDIAQVTRVRAAYIGAIESFDFKALPARPFVVGYVRAYAQALGLDAEAVVARFHAQAPKVDGKLRPPGGVRQDAFGSVRLLMMVGAVVAAAVGAWNLAKRAELRSASPADAPASRAPTPRLAPGPASIGAPLPTPPEATTPPVYQTPGLTPPDVAKASAAGAKPPVKGKGAIGPTDGDPAVVGPPFTPAGTVYGAATHASGAEPEIVLQARKATSLIVHGPDGGILFARLLSPGEAWRAPATPGLAVDVAEPAMMEVFVGGTSRGRLTQAQTQLGRLTDP